MQHHRKAKLAFTSYGSLTDKERIERRRKASHGKREQEGKFCFLDYVAHWWVPEAVESANTGTYSAQSLLTFQFLQDTLRWRAYLVDTLNSRLVTIRC